MKFSVRRAIIFTSILLVWCTHLIITPTSYFMTKHALKHHMKEIMLEISELTVSQALNYLDKAQVAASIDMQLIGSNVVGTEVEETSSIERYFFDQLRTNHHLSSIYVGGLNGNFFMVRRNDEFDPGGFQTKIIRHDKEGKTVKNIWRDEEYMLFHFVEDPTDDYDPRKQIWFAEGLAYEHLIWTDPYILSTVNKPGITFSGQVSDRDEGLIGVVGVDIELSDLSTFIGKLRVGKSGEAFIINHNGDVVAYKGLGKFVIPTETDKTLRLPKVQELGNMIAANSFKSVDWQYDEFGNISLKEPILSNFKLDGKNYLAMFTPFPEPELPWIICLYLPEDDYLGEIKANQVYIFIITFIMAILASILGYFLAKKITTPVVQLADGAKEIENRNIEAPFQLETPFKEIQNTADSFARMKESLSSYERKLLENQRVYRAITNTANDAIVMIDSNHEIIFFNPSAEKMFGYTSKEIIGSRLVDLLVPKQDETLYREVINIFLENRDDASPDLNNQLYQKVKNIFSGGIPNPFEDRMIKVTAINKNGQEIPVELSLSKFMLDDTLHAVAIIRNITDRVKVANMRKRLVNDLHDGVGGNITNIKLLAEISQSHDIPEQTIKNLHAIADISEDCITEIRNYMNMLDEKELSWQSFAAEVHNYCAKTLEPHAINFSMPVDISMDSPPPTTLLYMNVFKIIKESLNNVIKHSSADTMSVTIQIKENHIMVTIQDNGLTDNAQIKYGRGLFSMTSRVKELGGIIDFNWEQGANISLNIPFSKISVHETAMRDTS